MEVSMGKKVRFSTTIMDDINKKIGERIKNWNNEGSYWGTLL